MYHRSNLQLVFSDENNSLSGHLFSQSVTSAYLWDLEEDLMRESLMASVNGKQLVRCMMEGCLASEKFERMHRRSEFLHGP